MAKPGKGGKPAGAKKKCPDGKISQGTGSGPERRGPKYLNKEIEGAHLQLKRVLRKGNVRSVLKSGIMRSRQYDKKRGYRLGRKLDNDPEGSCTYSIFDPGAGEYVDFAGEVKDTLERKGKAAVLDIGAGDGHFLSQLKEKFGERVETTAVALTKSPEMAKNIGRGGIDKFSGVSAESFLPKRHYDLVVSYFGGIYYSAQPHIALRKAANSLAEGGTAYIFEDYPEYPEKVWELYGGRRTKSEAGRFFRNRWKNMLKALEKSGKFKVALLVDGIRISRVG